MGQSSPSPSRDLRLKSYGPKRSEIRPQWLVRPPTMRARHQMNAVPGARVYGWPGISQPSTQAQYSPHGRLYVDFLHRGDSIDHVLIARATVLSDALTAL